jgi:NADP-dependent 3-hydroxy acid dehydrogenase YdfG
MGATEVASPQDFDRQYLTNVRAPYVLTQAFLPMLVSHQGQIAFINSSIIRAARSNVSQFAATQHALRAVADCLREEVNVKGVRVLSVFPGRTATERQATIHQWEGKPYHQERLLQPEDVAAVVVNALELPRTAEVTDIHIRPMNKPQP